MNVSRPLDNPWSPQNRAAHPAPTEAIHAYTATRHLGAGKWIGMDSIELESWMQGSAVHGDLQWLYTCFGVPCSPWVPSLLQLRWAKCRCRKGQQRKLGEVIKLLKHDKTNEACIKLYIWIVQSTVKHCHRCGGKCCVAALVKSAAIICYQDALTIVEIGRPPDRGSNLRYPAEVTNRNFFEKSKTATYLCLASIPSESHSLAAKRNTWCGAWQWI